MLMHHRTASQEDFPRIDTNSEVEGKIARTVSGRDSRGCGIMGGDEMSHILCCVGGENAARHAKADLLCRWSDYPLRRQAEKMSNLVSAPPGDLTRLNQIKVNPALRIMARNGALCPAAYRFLGLACPRGGDAVRCARYG